jgi:hypothetical protein
MSFYFIDLQVVRQKSNAQASEETKADPTADINQDDSEMAVENYSPLTPDKSAKPISTSCGDTTVISFSDMLASPDMCRSFLSFLDVGEEETAEETKEESSKQAAMSIKVTFM